MKDFEICWKLNSRSKSSESSNILGVRVEVVKNGISLSQRQCIEEIARTLSFRKGNKVYTSMEPHSTPRKFLESEDENFDSHLYRQLIGSLMQLSTWTRPDIAHSVSVLSHFFQIQLEDTGHWLEE